MPKTYARPADAIDLNEALTAKAMEPPEEDVKEAPFQKQVVNLAVALGWKRELIYHTHDSRRSGKGFPDLVMLRPPRILYVELKRQKNAYTSPEQDEWLGALKECGAEVFLWRPLDWDEIIRVLK